MILTGPDKQKIVALFLAGASMPDIATQYAIRRQTLEQVFREAIRGLAKLNGEVLKDLALSETAQSQIEAHTV